MSSKSVSTLALLISANAQQLTGEFNRVDNLISRTTNKWQRNLSGGLKMGIGIGTAEAALATINREIQHVIQTIENIPGVPAAVVSSITEARVEFQSFRNSVDGVIAKMLHFARLAAQSVGAGAAMLFGGASADDVSAGLGKLPSPDDVARSKDPGFDARVRAALGRLREAEVAARRVRLTPGAQYSELMAEADRFKTYAGSSSINSEQKVGAQLEAQKRIDAANQLFAKARDESNKALERWRATSEAGGVSKMRDRDAVSKLTAEITALEVSVGSVNAALLSGGGADIQLLEKRTALYEQLRQKQELLNPILQRQRAEIQAIADSAAGSLTSGLEAGILAGRKFSAVLKEIGDDLIRLVLRKTLLEPLGSGLSGGLVKMLGFASGGRPPVGVPSVVGERGPEIFVPDSAGRIIPNHAIGGSSGSSVGNTYMIDARGADAGVVQRLGAALQALAGPGVVERRALVAVAEGRRRGGVL